MNRQVRTEFSEAGPELGGVQQVQLGVVLDQSPLGVDAAHERVVLQHLLQTCNTETHSKLVLLGCRGNSIT